jgi:phage-related minor tail protein
MDLAELKFVVDTKQLEEAAKQIEALGTSVSKLNKPMQEFTKESAKTSKELSKAEEAAAKAALAQVKLEQAQTKSVQATGKSNSVLERQNLILEYMAQGNSKGQSSILATAKAAGALDDEMLALNKTLTTQRTLIGGDPFDKSIGLMQKLQNEYKTTSEVTNLFNKNLGLTEKQMIDLAREKERLIALYGIEGKSLDGLAAEYEQIVQMSRQINQANDARTNGMKAQIKAQNDAAKATAYVADVDARLAAALSETNKALDKQSTDALVKYEKALRQTGMSSDEAAVKLANVKKQFEGVAEKKQADKLQYLARAISVQMGDVGISLASGMNPLLVMIQQGDQIRGAIQQAGASGKELEKAMAGAATQIATSFVQTGQAIGGFFVNAVKSAGQAIIGLPISLASSSFAAMTGNVEANAKAFDNLKVASMAAGKVGLIFVITAIAALAVEYTKVAAAEKELTKSLSMSGAALGMSTDGAIKYAQAMNDVGVGTMDAMRIIAEFASTGADANMPLKEIIKSAQDIQKYVGIASKDTVKAFADIAEKPVEGLIKLAKSTGNVTAETILQAEAAVKAGDNAEAARIAQEALSNSNAEVVRRMKNNLDPLQTLWLDIKTGISKAGEALYDFLKSSTMIAIFRTAWETISVIVAEVWYVLKQTGAEISGIASQIKAVMTGDFAGAARIGDQMKVAAATAREEQDKLIASILNRNKAEKETLTITESQRVANRAAAKEIEDRIKKEKEKTPKTDAEKEQLRLLKESEKYLSRVYSLTNAATKEQEEYTKAQKLALDIFSDPDFKNYPESQRIKIANALEQAHAEELVANELTKQRVIQKQIYDEYTKLQAKRDDAMIAAIDNSVALNKVIKEESDELILQGSLIGKTDAERKKAIKTRQAEVLLAKELADISKLTSLNNGQDIAELQAQAYQRFADRAKNINTEIANDFAAEMQKQYDIISNGLTDATITGLFEGGKAGSKKLRDLVVAELKKPITIVVKALVDATLGNLIQSFVGGSSGDAVSSFAGSATGSAATGGLSGLTIGGASIASQASAFGAGVANGFGPLAGMQSGGLATSTSYNLGATYGAPVAGVLAGVYGGRAVSGGYSAMGGASGNSAVNIGTAIGMAIAGPLGAALGGLAGGAFNRTFGRKLAGIGIEGTLGGASGFEGNRYTFEKGGWLRSDKYTPSVLEEADRSAIASDFRLIKSSVMELAETAGFGSDAIKDFTQRFAIDLMGLSPEDATKKYQEEFAKIEESMAKAVIGTSGYRRENETNVQALTRLSTFMGGINGAFKKLGFETYKLELSSIDAAQGFVDLFGGIEGFNQAMGFFYENFFSDTEKINNLTTDLTTAFSELGLELPKSREGFKALVTSARAAGDDQLVADLLALQYGFADLVPAASSAVGAIEDMKQQILELTGTDSQILASQRASILASTDPALQSAQAYIFALEDVRTAQDALTAARNREGDVLKSTITNLKNYAESLRQYSQSLLLGSQTTLTPEQQYREASAQFDALLAAATGPATTPEEIARRDSALSQLQGASSSFLEASRMYNASSAQYTQDFNYVQEALTSTASALDAQVTDAQKQLSALGLINTSVLSVADAINNLAAAQGLANSLAPAAASQLGSALVSGDVVYGAQGSSSSLSQFKTDVESWMNQTAAKDYFAMNPDVAAAYSQNSYGMSQDEFAKYHYQMYGMAEGRVSPEVEADMVKSLYAKLVGEWKLSSATLAQIMGTSQQSILDYFTPYGLPAFAKGTNYVPDDMYAQIHKGERIIPAADNARLFQSLSDRNATNSVLVAEIRNLRQEIVELRDQQSKETATIVVSNLDAQQRNADSINTTISNTSKESNWNSKVRESVKLK